MMSNIKKLLNDLTLKEKILILSGFDAWHTNKVERLDIPSIKMSDGPNGVRGNGNSGKSSACFPSAISLGSTWNMGLINRLGLELGEESKAKDVDVLLGPTINIHRHPLGGRHFESFSEDPYLTGRIAVEYVNGVQTKNVAACLKHFVGNDTEFERYTVSSNIEEKTLREVYLLPFEMAVKQANAKVVMSAYHKLNNIYCSSHKELLINILKKESIIKIFDFRAISIILIKSVSTFFNIELFLKRLKSGEHLPLPYLASCFIVLSKSIVLILYNSLIDSFSTFLFEIKGFKLNLFEVRSISLLLLKKN